MVSDANVEEEHHHSAVLPSTTSPPPKQKKKQHILLVCDMQPDVVRKLQPASSRHRWVDLTQLAVEAARQSRSRHTTIIYTLLRFEEPQYTQVPPWHPRLGILRRMSAHNPTIRWFTSDALAITPLRCTTATTTKEVVVPRTTLLPHAHQEKLMQVLRDCIGDNDDNDDNEDQDPDGRPSITVVGYGPTVHALCHILGDVLALPHVQILQECVGDEVPERRDCFLQHGLLFNEKIISLVEYLAEMDLLYERIAPATDTLDVDQEAKAEPSLPLKKLPPPSTPKNKYVSDCQRGGHLCLYLPYLLDTYNYTEWPTQLWYQEQFPPKAYQCPVGRRTVDLCDEPQFSQQLRFFLPGRKHLDQKDLLHQLVPDLMPPTFTSIAAAQEYEATMRRANEHETATTQHDGTTTEKVLWFIKAVNQNGGRAVRITNNLSIEPPVSVVEQVQLHIPRPLLYEGKFKFHVKTYQHISCNCGGPPPSSTSNRARPSSPPLWQVYMHDLFFLSVAASPWSTDDLSDAAQITTMRTHRMYPDHALRTQWNLTHLIRDKMHTLLRRAIEQGKLHTVTNNAKTTQPTTTPTPTVAMVQPQFEVNSADWMLDENGRVYLIECNGIPVLYDPHQQQALVTRGLNLYDKLYQEDPINAVVNDTALLQEALCLAVTGEVPDTSLWKHVMTVPVSTTEAVAETTT